MKENQLQINLSKPFIRHWKEIFNNKHRKGLGYEKENTFHILDYSKQVKFVSARILHEDLKEKDSKFQQIDAKEDDKQSEESIDECQHCHRVGHMEDQCFGLHPCQHCRKCNHSSEGCSKL